MTFLFIGVVSHEGSRFALSQGADGLAAQLASRMAERDIDVAVRVNTCDLHDDTVNPVTEAMVQASLTEQVHLDRRWAAYLGRERDGRWWAHHALRWARRAEQAVRRPGPSMVRRLLNIELSHMDLLRAGSASGADWILILEDDACSPDPYDTADGLLGLMSHSGTPPAYVNVSRSFSNDELGITHLVQDAPASWEGSRPRQVLAVSRPVTNTVCAILYRGDFVPSLMTAMGALPDEPVVPIDWKLNLALMDLFSAGVLGAGDCWLVEPAPIDQLSMHETA